MEGFVGTKQLYFAVICQTTLLHYTLFVFLVCPSHRAFLKGARRHGSIDTRSSRRSGICCRRSWETWSFHQSVAQAILREYLPKQKIEARSRCHIPVVCNACHRPIVLHHQDFSQTPKRPPRPRHCYRHTSQLSTKYFPRAGIEKNSSTKSGALP